MKDLEALQRDYARLLIREGLNIQPGQRLAIKCPVDCAAFGRLCAEAAYDAGCSEVLFRWGDDALARMKYLRASDEVFDRVDPWDVLMSDTLTAEGAGALSISASDPEMLKGVDGDRIRRYQIAAGKAMEKIQERGMRNEYPWCVCSIPTPVWAKKVFPDLPEDEAVMRLWEEILKACRVDGVDAVAAWQKHNAELQKHVEFMNRHNFKSLHYTNSLGTDLTLELPEGHFWAGGAEKCVTSGIMFSANIPTEEVFTLPKRDSVNGVVYASKPLVLHGNVIEGIRFTFKDGKIVDAYADTGEDILRDAIAVDEGASYLGEVALVPYDSPINASGVLFFNTLFDENASCHLAFGDSYPCIHGSESMTGEQLAALGANKSMMHEDFMVGTADLSIVGTTHDGEKIPVFVNGNFAF